MSAGPNRLGGVVPPEFAKPVIDRARPIRFRLDGRTYAAYAGDTVLSALLANGVTAVGKADSSPLTLDAASAPPICLVGNEARPDLAMPMDLCPTVDGANFVSLGTTRGKSAGWAGRLMTHKTSLGLTYTDTDPAPGGWIDTPASRQSSTEIVVVGGGVAGLSAALAAAEQGLRVTIVEREPVLGGISPFFGRADGEPVPDELIAKLSGEIASSNLITVYLDTMAFDLQGTTLRALRIARTGGMPEPEHLAITGNTIVLATGASGRLPVFPGNLLPGVIEASAAWRLAARYNVWPAGTAHVHTGTNAGYRMALLGAAAERSIERTTDPRHAPQTRFIEFCKAYGYRLGWGVSIASATPQNGALRVELIDSLNGKATQDSLVCHRLIVSGGWQPDLDLWLKSGGGVRWDKDAQQVMADGDRPDIKLAGAVAGYQSLTGCADHGRAVLSDDGTGDKILVADPRIDPVFETPDGLLTVTAPRERSAAPAWVCPARITRLPRPGATGLAGFVRRPEGKRALAPRAHNHLDILGVLVSGAAEPDHLSRYAQEHCMLPVRLEPLVPTAVSSVRPDPLPSYLGHRFGPGQVRWSLTLESARTFDPGCLVFLNTDERSPLAAVGVVVVGTSSAIEILATGDRLSDGDTVYVRDGLAVVPARLKPLPTS
ncbi:FAD-dependent oxidoreductase [Pelagibacterium luteolum]|uniref:Sarcosine oxidase subunit alpha n=1 Tax=Pelagibacterium luteolum TaxID=440168 RepID=A0A1G7TMC6_9HYPH|nr:FAD-dependent oxidoreductase [Pelagibacterium luteolum]SDG36493.1 sarcosine oxidase subunit alpha [Pelagibacterium luteolum]